MGIALEIHLRHQSILPSADLKMDMCRPHQIRSGRIGCRLDRLVSIPPLRVGDEHRGPVEIRVERSRIRVARMRVAPIRIGLPHLDRRVANWLPSEVQDAPHDVEHLSGRATGATGHARQIGGSRELPERIEWARDVDLVLLTLRSAAGTASRAADGHNGGAG